MPTSPELARCWDVLPAVSRTFALTIPVLPPSLAPSVCVAYLLCRIADTVEDRPDLSVTQRATSFGRLLAVVADLRDEVAQADFARDWPPGDDGPDERLVAALPAVARALADLPAEHRRPILACAREMTSGMAATFEREPADGVRYVCDDLAGLERYCHFVAGTVGVMLTRLFASRVGDAFARPDRIEQGRRFGLGLQLTNVLRDHPEDVARGTCFVPRPWLRPAGRAAPGPALHEGALAALVERAMGHLDAAEAYTLALPGAGPESGTRLFCLWASWMAAATLREVANDPLGAPRIGRDEVAHLLGFTREHLGDDDALRRRYAELREATLDAVARRAAPSPAFAEPGPWL